MPRSARPPALKTSRLPTYARHFDHQILCRPGWPRILRNTLVGFIVQAGTRLVAALSYYALLAAGPTLVLTGQLAWAFAMERRGRGDLASQSPCAARLADALDPFAHGGVVNGAQHR